MPPGSEAFGAGPVHAEVELLLVVYSIYIVYGIELQSIWYRVDSKQLEYGCRIVYAGFPSFFGLGLVVRWTPKSWSVESQNPTVETRIVGT